MPYSPVGERLHVFASGNIRCALVQAADDLHTAWRNEMREKMRDRQPISAG
jgi:hypothetical protein